MDYLSNLSNFLEEWCCQIDFDQLDDFHKELFLKVQTGDIDFIKNNIQKITDKNIINSLFFVATRFSKTTETIITLHNHFKCIDYFTVKNSTLLFCAVLNNNIDIIKCLIDEYKLNVNHLNNEGINCSIVAFESDNLHMIKYLIEEHHIDIHHIDNKKISCYAYLLSNGSYSIIKYFINEHKLNPTNLIDINNKTCNYLQIACRNNPNLDVIVMLVEEYGIQIDKLSIWCALAKGNLDIIKYLIAMYKTKSQCDEYDELKYESLLQVPIHSINVVKFLVEESEFSIGSNNVPSKNAFMRSCRDSKSVDVVKYFADHLNQKINCFDSTGKNCLMLACQFNPNLDIIKYLIQTLNIDPHILRGGKNCLMYTCLGNSNVSIIKYLINDCMMDVTENAMQQYVTFSCLNNNNAIFKYLLKYSKNQTIELPKSSVKSEKLINIIDLVIDNIKSIGFNHLLGQISVHDHYNNDECILSHIRSKNPLLFNPVTRNAFNIPDPMKLKYVDFVNYVDQLEEQILILGFDDIIYSNYYIIENNIIENNIIEDDTENDTEKLEFDQQLQENDEFDFSVQNDILFKHNGKPYFGHRKIVYKSIPVFQCIIGSADFSEPMDLNIDVPEYIINLYIASTYTHKLNLKMIKPCDFIKFLKLIDQYPTQILSINRIEKQIIGYFFDFYQEVHNDIDFKYLEDILRKYNFKLVYLMMHNKKYIN